jgi:hypothetical protein
VVRSWQQGPLSPRAIGLFLVAEPLPKKLLRHRIMLCRPEIDACLDCGEDDPAL